MRLTVLASGSAGNGYLLEARHSALLVECGVKPEVLMRRTAVPVSKIAGALITHEHRDHAGYAERYAALGVPIYASRGTLAALPRFNPGATARPVASMQTFRAGEFIIRAFDTRHDASEPLGFIIEHPEAGRILFLTDTAFCPYDFSGIHLDHIMVEANYDDRLLDSNVANGLVEEARATRTRRDHMSLRSACELIQADETEDLKTVILIHLSGQNADPARFAREVGKIALFARVEVAVAGLSIELEKFEI